MTQLNVNSENYITTRAMAILLCLTSERIRQLEDEGVFTSITKSGKKYFDLTPNIQSYIQHIKAKEKEKGDVAPDELTSAQMQIADLRYKTARAGKMEMELAELEGQMHRAEDVEVLVSDMIAKLRAGILALPGRLAVDTAEANTPMEASAIIKRAVDDLLNDTADYRYSAADYKRLVSEREKWLSVKEAETAKQELKTEKKTRKTVSKKAATSSRSSAKASKHRKT